MTNPDPIPTEAERPAVLRIDPTNSQRFTWRCPKCGALNMGKFGITPVGGFLRDTGVEPVWVMTGEWDAPTLEPSLGCWNCYPDGHYWLRNGVLVDA